MLYPKIEIDGSEMKAFLWEFRVHACEGTTIKVSCWQHNGPGLSLPRADIVPVEKQVHHITFNDGLGAEAKYRVELSRIESHEKVDEVPFVDYFFVVPGMTVPGQIHEVPSIKDIRSMAKTINPDLVVPEGE